MLRGSTRSIAAFVADLRYEDLPPAVVEAAKTLTLDTLGTALAATTLGEGCAAVVAVMRALGGPAESRILGTPARVAAPHAAFANGALAHALNFDAVGHATGHAGVVAFAAPFALAQARAPVSGRRYLTAVVAGLETAARVTLAAKRAPQPVSPRLLAGQFFSYVGCAAACARLLDLGVAATHSALGLALMQTAGARQVVVGGDPPAKAIYGAFPAQAGVQSALLAQAGLGAEIDALDGDAALFAIATGGTFDADALTGELGRRYAFPDVQYKPWAVSNHVAPFIEAALAIRARPGFDAAAIVAIEVSGAAAIRAWFEPPERRRPANGAAAANAIPFAVAKALAHGDVRLADFSPAGLRDERAGALADRVTPRVDDTIAGGTVRVTTDDGREERAAVDVPLGDPSRPLTRERLQAKFRDCCSYAPSIGAAGAERLITAVGSLEASDDVATLL